jgi:hypothetical protein
MYRKAEDLAGLFGIFLGTIHRWYIYSTYIALVPRTWNYTVSEVLLFPCSTNTSWKVLYEKATRPSAASLSV